MKIVVTHKWASNPAEAVVAADGTVDLSRAKPGLGDYDQVAIEVARGLGGELIGLSVGGPEAGSPLARKAALSRGLDRLVVIADPAQAQAGPAATGRVLADAITEIGDVELVLTGDASVDEGAGLVPSVLAGRLGWPVLAGVSAVVEQDGQVQVTRSAGAGSQTLTLRGPAVLSVAPDAALARIPGMKDILAAGKKPVQTLSAQPPTAAEQPPVVDRARPAAVDRRRVRITTPDPSAAVDELVAALRADNVL